MIFYWSSIHEITYEFLKTILRGGSDCPWLKTTLHYKFKNNKRLQLIPKSTLRLLGDA
jgi:hypothetical protein